MKVSEALDHLIRADIPRDLEELPVVGDQPNAIAACRIRGIGREEKSALLSERNATFVGSTFRFVTEDALAGLWALAVPVSMRVSGAGGSVDIGMGVWTTRRDQAAPVLSGRRQVLKAVLNSAYPKVDYEDRPLNPAPRGPADNRTAVAKAGSLVVGIPSAKPPSPFDPSAPWDRIIRALAGTQFEITILAQPIAAAQILARRRDVVAEIRRMQHEVKAEGMPAPLVDHYIEQLKVHLDALVKASSIGAWRSAVYLTGEEAGHARAIGVWLSTFTGPQSLPEPLQSRRHADVATWAERTVMPSIGPVHQAPLARPFELQTMLTSTQLAAYLHLPERETPGFSVDVVPVFDTVIDTGVLQSRDSIPLGQVVASGRPTPDIFAVTSASLTKHCLVAGVTGAGKSTTIRHLIEEIARARIPFMVLEPAKSEYRSLAALGATGVVYTVGDEAVSPLRLNPLEVPPGTPVGVHLDYLKALFTASFGLWAPLPQILERCLHRIYESHGWDVEASRNPRVVARNAPPEAFPTLGDLYREVEHHIGSLGYEGEVTANMRAALSTRVDGLTSGAKGRMFVTREGVRQEDLFERNTILELERLPDEDDQAFVIGILMIRLLERCRARGARSKLQHLLIVEEAHRLLAEPPKTPDPGGGARAKAVQTFVNMLAELRSYGQGVLVADQVPTRLAPDVVKNTNLKIVHRLVADDDRTVVGAATVMDQRQTRSLATLPSGRAAVFAEGQDAPVLLDMLSDAASRDLTDEALSQARADNADNDCRRSCRGTPQCRAAARAQTPDLARQIDRMAQTLVDDPTAASRLWPPIIDQLRPHIEDAPIDAVAECVAYRNSQEWAMRRGHDMAWSYADTRAVAGLLADALLKQRQPDGLDAARAYAAAVRTASVRRNDPYPACSAICAQQQPVCLYRFAVSDATTPRMREKLGTAATLPQEEATVNPFATTWRIAATVGSSAIEFPEAWHPADTFERLRDAGIRASLCAAQQAILANESLDYPHRIRVVNELLEYAVNQYGAPHSDEPDASHAPAEPREAQA